MAPSRRISLHQLALAVAVALISLEGDHSNKSTQVVCCERSNRDSVLDALLCKYADAHFVVRVYDNVCCVNPGPGLIISQCISEVVVRALLSCPSWQRSRSLALSTSPLTSAISACMPVSTIFVQATHLPCLTTQLDQFDLQIGWPIVHHSGVNRLPCRTLRIQPELTVLSSQRSYASFQPARARCRRLDCR